MQPCYYCGSVFPAGVRPLGYSPDANESYIVSNEKEIKDFETAFPRRCDGKCYIANTQMKCKLKEHEWLQACQIVCSGGLSGMDFSLCDRYALDASGDLRLYHSVCYLTMQPDD